MAEGTYEYECSRAELLGIAKPTYEEFLKNRSENSEVNQEELNTENLAEAESQNDNLKGIGVKLDELNHILQGTQKRLNRFKVSYGSLTNILKIKLGRNPDSPSSQSDTDNVPANDDTESRNTNTDKNEEEVNGSIGCDNDIERNTNENSENSIETPIRKSDLSKALDNQVDSLDRLADKAEQLELGIQAQTSQMKKLLNFRFLK